jgi:uncharacterized membrane protein
MKMTVKSGAVLAAAALSFAVSGVALTTASQAASGKVMCVGVNSCKGQSECKTAMNNCKGMNSCKGHGWLSLSKADCKKMGGKIGDMIKN